MLRYIDVKSRKHNELIDITAAVQDIVSSAGIDSGICHVFAMHTTAGITINESADPAVQRDIINSLSRLVPADSGYTHSEGNSDAHIKSAIVGSSQTLIIAAGKAVLGTWQAVYFCEFDGPRQRRIAVKVIADS